MRLMLCSGFRVGIKFSWLATMSNARARCFQREECEDCVAEQLLRSSARSVYKTDREAFAGRGFLEKIFRFNIGFTPPNSTK